MSKLLPSRIKPVTIIIAGLILLTVTAGAWWVMVYNTPGRVFERMLANSLATVSVTKSVSQADQSQRLNQITRLTSAPQQQVHASSVLNQKAEGNTTITTESIGTPATDYIRYTDIKTSEKNSKGKEFDFTSVVGVWGKSDQNDQEGGGAQLFSQTLLGVVPIGNVPQPFRGQLLRQMKDSNVYAIDQGSVKKKTVYGRPVYSYDVTVQPVPYVTMLKAFAKGVGLTHLEQIDPNQYARSAPLKFALDIDVLSGQLTKIAYKDSDRTEVLSGYGARVPVKLPVTSIPVNELQARLQKIQ